MVVTEHVSESMTFDVGFIEYVEAELVAEVQEHGVVRIVGCAHSVEVESLEQ